RRVVGQVLPEVDGDLAVGPDGVDPVAVSRAQLEDMGPGGHVSGQVFRQHVPDDSARRVLGQVDGMVGLLVGLGGVGMFHGLSHGVGKFFMTSMPLNVWLPLAPCCLPQAAISPRPFSSEVEPRSPKPRRTLSLEEWAWRTSFRAGV